MKYESRFQKVPRFPLLCMWVQNTVAGVTKFFVMSLGDMAGSSFRLDNDNGRVYKRVESS